MNKKRIKWDLRDCCDSFKMDYYQPVRDQFIQKQMYPNEYRKDFFPAKGLQGGFSVLTLDFFHNCHVKTGGGGITVFLQLC